MPSSMLLFNSEISTVSPSLRSEIELCLGCIQQATPGAIHSAIQAGLEDMGWSKEVPVAEGLDLRFDVLKEGVAVEIEFGLKEAAYKEWVKFLKGLADGSIHAGVHVMRCEPGNSANCHASWAAQTLDALANVFPVPVLIYGVSI